MLVRKRRLVMTWRILSLATLLTVVAVLGGQTTTPPQKGETDEELSKKIKMLQDQIQDLRNKQNDLIAEQKKRNSAKQEKERLEKIEAQRKEDERRKKEEAERIAKEAADKKKHVAKVEVR